MHIGSSVQVDGVIPCKGLVMLKLVRFSPRNRKMDIQVKKDIHKRVFINTYAFRASVYEALLSLGLLSPGRRHGCGDVQLGAGGALFLRHQP